MKAMFALVWGGDFLLSGPVQDTNLTALRSSGQLSATRLSLSFGFAAPGCAQLAETPTDEPLGERSCSLGGKNRMVTS